MASFKLHCALYILCHLSSVDLFHERKDQILSRCNLQDALATIPSYQDHLTRFAALTPELVQIFPSTTHLAGDLHLTCGPMAVIVAQALLFVVAARPSSTPARATMPAPVHTLIRYFKLGYVFLTKSICVLTLRVLTPPPPGTKSTSISLGGLA